MVRNNGKLISFLKDNLEKNSFINLKWEDETSGIFKVEFKHSRKKDLKDFEKILIGWYSINDKLHSYSGYSCGRSVFLQALRASDYLMPVPLNKCKYRYRFANRFEVEENKRNKRQKRKSTNNNQLLETSDSQQQAMPIVPNLGSPVLSPPSVSSGYQSADEDFDENMQVMPEANVFEESDISSLIEQYLNTDEIMTEDFTDFFNVNEDLDEIKVDDLYQPTVESSAVLNTKTIWMYKEKVNIDPTLILIICEKQIIQNDDVTTDGNVVIPHDVWEAEKNYLLQKVLECEGKYLLFFSHN